MTVAIPTSPRTSGICSHYLNGAEKRTSSAKRGSYLNKADLLLRSSASLGLAAAVTRAATERRLYLSRLLTDCEDEY